MRMNNLMLLGFLLPACGVQVQTGSLYGAPIYNCADYELTEKAAVLAVEKLVAVLIEDGYIDTKEEFTGGLSELEIECVNGPRSYRGVRYLGLYQSWPQLDIEIVDPESRCIGGRILIHELIHWTQDRLLGEDLAHYLPWFGPFGDECRNHSIECRAYLSLYADKQCQAWHKEDIE